jgi:hypothetical protein
MSETTGPTAQILDLFGRHDPLLGRALCMDQACGCGSNVTLIGPGRGPHDPELRCRNCDRHRQWLSHEDYRLCGAVLAEITGRFGEPAEISYRVIKQKRTEAMATEQHDNSGILFRNSDKTKETDRDYRGEATVGGVNYWVSGWIKEGKKGKFMTFSFKPKDAPKEKAASSAPFNDEIPFAPELRG